MIINDKMFLFAFAIFKLHFLILYAKS